MKKLMILLACAGLLAACHRGENRNAGTPGMESGTYQGSSETMTNSSTNSVITPEQQPNY